MSLDATTVMTILLMATVTYATRVVGFLTLRNRVLSAKAVTVMEAAPGCVLVSVIAPDFASKNPADFVALAITVMAATRFSMLPTVLIGVLSSAALRWVFA
jgi:uncharacterized membrane protein